MEQALTITHPVPGVALLTINRPDRFNAIDPATNQALGEALAALNDDDAVRCIVLTGAGNKAFCAGADIPTLLPFLKRNIAEGRDEPQFGGVTHHSMAHQPLIAAINGVALGGGLEIALACDLRIASSNARFGLPEISVGVLAGAGGCTRLPRTVPAALAAQMILTGEPIGAEHALQAGLISEITTQEELLPRALEIAQRIASRAPLSVRACTELLRRPRFQELKDALREERAAFARVVLSEDAVEGIQAFTEKRVPAFANQ